MKIVDAEVVDRYNGTIQVTVSKEKKRIQNKSVRLILNNEKEFGLFNDDVWETFNKNVFKTKSDLKKILKQLKNDVALF